MNARTSTAFASLVLTALAGCTDVTHETSRLDCNGCHSTLYDQRADHVDAGLARTCYECHGTTSWPRAVRAHSYPINREPHAGWDCADCHVGTTNAVSCIQCHAHSAGRTDPLHLSVSNYTWAPTSCVACHRNSRRRG